jgi:hypothetical protein
VLKGAYLEEWRENSFGGCEQRIAMEEAIFDLFH